MAMTQDEIDQLIDTGQMEEEKEDKEEEKIEEEATSVDKPQLAEMEYQGEEKEIKALDPKLELLYDLQLPVSIELGRTNMLIRNILRLGRGSVIEFDKLVREPVDVLINNKKVAEGEVVVIDKHFGIRITTLVDPSERLRGIKAK